MDLTEDDTRTAALAREGVGATPEVAADLSVDRAAPSDLLARKTGLTGASEPEKQLVDTRSKEERGE